MASPENSDHSTASNPPTREHVSLLAVLRRRALIIVLVMLLAGGAAAAFVFATRDTYESTAKLLFRQTIGPELNAMGLLPGRPTPTTSPTTTSRSSARDAWRRPPPRGCRRAAWT